MSATSPRSRLSLKMSCFSDIHAEVWRNFQVYYLISMLVGFFIFYLLQRFFKEQGEKQSEDFHVRGFRLVEPQVLTKMQIKRAKVNRKRGYGDGTISKFKIDGHALLKQSFEVQHLLIDGTTGAGKSVMIRKLVRWIRNAWRQSHHLRQRVCVHQ
ncbi:type IV secretion system DNA-binding domain-containing protein [Vibrio splendidus]|uniref:type IV secretion system DNA-binding domain-containing protein n=1 Tax=Vibrio splendidus TaxID=29497 RepID=UPI0039A5D658